MTLRYFPASLMREASVQWDLRGMVITGGPSLSGQQPATRLDGGGLWKATMSNVSLITADQVRAWRALSAVCDGGAQPIVVPMCDRRHFPAPLVGGAPLYSLPDVPHSDDSPFDDDSEYAGDVVSATLGSAAALRATSLIVAMETIGSELRGGEYFSIDHENLRWRTYRIRTAVLDEGSGNYAITIRPPLRAAVDAGAALQFDQPKCVMRLATSDAMDLVLEQRKFGNPSVSFIEAFPPFPEE